MRLRHAPAIFAFAALTTFVLCESGRADDVLPEKELPKWRLQATALFDEGNALGVYRRIGQRWDLGIQAAASLRDRESDSDRTIEEELDDTESRRRSETMSGEGLAVDLDLRRWSGARDRVRWFMGPRVGVGFDHSTRNYETVKTPSGDTSNAKFEDDTFRIDTSLVMGGDLELRSRFSVAFALQPVRFAYPWTDQNGEEAWNEVIGSNSYTARDDEESEGWSIATGLSPSVYLTLGID